MTVETGGATVHLTAERGTAGLLRDEDLSIQLERDLSIEFGSSPRVTTGPAVINSISDRSIHWRNALSTRAKRWLDVVLSVFALTILAPVALAVAAAVKVSSPGPAHFTQDRVGKGGKFFRIIKFRTMSVSTQIDLRSSDDDWDRYVANDFKLDKGDPRITRLGRFLRATSLDEIPQLWNVLRGEMSLVGVRPLIPEELDLRPRADYYSYCSMSPGMTGQWQVSGRSEVTDFDRHELDRQYLENWSFWKDIKILALTPLTVIRTSRTH